VPRKFRDADDAVLVLGDCEGTWLETGRSFQAGFAHLHAIDNGRIRRLDQLTDTFQIAEAMGLARRAKSHRVLAIPTSKSKGLEP
jgi:ketosteroid isomerase-like protein